ncbi:hypothetical protein Javan443_0046 [Streptococcus phage Javan443]|nr:hypothetical protein Javan443_0046 [Streptococcus phage Javan443]QBX18761.1 hypothetical protein Javan445_0021 [Streptococcus phage Javan445]
MIKRNTIKEIIIAKTITNGTNTINQDTLTTPSALSKNKIKVNIISLLHA